MLVNKLLETPILVTPAMCDDEFETEWDAMIQRSHLTQQLIDGGIDWEYYLDWMSEHGYDAGDLLTTAEQNLEFAQKEGIQLTY